MFKSVAALATLACLALGAQAQTQAPGLWEHSLKMTSANGEMERAQAQLQKQLAAMTPEKRQQIEDLMAKSGVHLGAQGLSAKTCVSQAQAAKPAEPHLSGDCTQTDLVRKGKTLNYKFACTSPRPATGEGQITYASTKSYTGQATVTTQADGKSQQMNMQMSGKWLGADCGGLLPADATTTK